jgi:hypothetical protein
MGGSIPPAEQYKQLKHNNMKLKVIFKVSNSGELFAVLLWTKKDSTYTCYSLYDATHFDADTLYLRECRNARGYNNNELCAYLEARGYKNIEVKQRMKY